MGADITSNDDSGEVSGTFDIYPIPDEFANDFREVRRLIEDVRFNEAKSLVLRLLERVPDHPRLLVVYARILFHAREGNTLKDIVGVEEIVLKAIEIAPDLPEAHSFLAILYQWTERSTEAAKHVRIAVKLDTKSAESWNSLGLYYGLQGEYQRSIDFFVAAYSLDSEYEVAAYNASCANAKMDRTEEALKYLKLVKSKRLLLGSEKEPDFDQIRDLPEFQRIIEENLNG